MKYQVNLSSRSSYMVFVILLALFFSCAGLNREFSYNRHVNFNNNWKFVNTDEPDAKSPDFDDSEWRTVDLPHDWSIKDYPMQDSLHIGPHYKNMPNGEDVGYLRGGIGWYRKTLTIPEDIKGKLVYLHFDGIQSQSQVYVNGIYVGEHVYGYTPFYFDITPYLNEKGPENKIAIKVVNPERNSRWFAGAGIYRDVSVSYLSPVHVAEWGAFVETMQIKDSKAYLSIDLDIVNELDTPQENQLRIRLVDPDNETATLLEEPLSLSTKQTASMVFLEDISYPMLWSVENPNLYHLQIEILQNNRIVDHYETSFGIRTLEWSAQKGFLINNQPVLMKGACLHHDNGLLGAAAFQRAEERRVRIMKQNGFNAIRTSHNPPSQAFLDACDKLGMLVIDESFDQWHKSKRPNDYSNYYKEWWEKDTRAMVLRDRNHPSVVMWSIGNEIQERADENGLQIAREAYDFIKSIDNSRPVTEAICDFWDNKNLEWNDTAPAFAILDIGGYNYQWKRYESDHERYPNRIMYGSENVAQEIYGIWQQVEQNPYIIGDFVWVGMDYLGEAGVGNTTYETDKNIEKSFFMPWPYYITWSGDIDIIGNKKPQSYYRDVIWGESKLEMAVHAPVPEGTFEMTSFWGWPDEYKHWNWQVPEGTSMDVSVYSAYPQVRLELNGQVVAEREITTADSLKLDFSVPYEKGELKVVGVVDGKDVGSKSLNTTGETKSILVQPERTLIDADRGEVVYVKVKAIDEFGAFVPNSIQPLLVKVEGQGELIAAGNGSPKVSGSFQDDEFSLFNGQGLIVVRSTGQNGNISIKVQDTNKEITGNCNITAQ